ncbi:type II toxin-antitoxin system VapC family toxin [Cyclobacterium salsum]|uniref:type II toxin-antitoxin system VapC family toxin n=1 Tax=Cyclobacterium salsum TaxID=2666329 RepID=UPI00192ECE82|nr:type II toxin-antitoxin system VapC family toxin [Cyclobacterium salsum]
MAGEVILLDTSILIDYFRKKNKRNSEFFQLVETKKYFFAVSAITEYEVYMGATHDQKSFWDLLFSNMRILEFNSQCAKEAVRIQKNLKQNNMMIAIPDLLIGATAKNNGLKIATKNTDHFRRITGLSIHE